MAYADKLYGTREQYVQFWAWACQPVWKGFYQTPKDFLTLCQYPSPADYYLGIKEFVICNPGTRGRAYLWECCGLQFVKNWLIKFHAYMEYPNE